MIHLFVRVSSYQTSTIYLLKSNAEAAGEVRVSENPFKASQYLLSDCFKAESLLWFCLSLGVGASYSSK